MSGKPFLGALAFALSALAHAQETEHAPFITTPSAVVERMLRFAGTGASDVVYDLGSGDGRIVIGAARLFGARGVGIELEPKLVKESQEKARLAGVAERVSFVQGDVLRADFSRATVVTVYLLPSLIARLQPRLLDELEPGTRIVSHAFAMVGWKADRSETMRVAGSHPGQGDESTLHLWVVPAKARGTWGAGDSSVRIYQNYQEIEVEGRLAGRMLAGTRARLSGRDIEWQSGGLRFRGKVEAARIVGELTLDERTSPLVLARTR